MKVVRLMAPTEWTKARLWRSDSDILAEGYGTQIDMKFGGP